MKSLITAFLLLCTFCLFSAPPPPVSVSGSLVFSNVANVKWTAFGAKGDGVTDDRAAIQSAIDSAATNANRNQVFIPPGIYISSGSITSKPNVTIFGAGWSTIVKMKDASSAHTFVNLAGSATNMTIRDLTIDQNFNNTTGPNYAIYWIGTGRSLIDHVHLINGRTGFNLEDHSSNNIVQNCTIDSFGTGITGQGIFLFRGAYGNIVRGNIIRNGGTSTVGILVDDATSTSVDSVPSFGNIIEGNTILDGVDAIGVEGCYDNLIAENLIRNMTGRGIYVQYGFGNAPSTNIMVCDNKVFNWGTDGGHESAIIVQGFNIKVSGNQISDSGSGARGITLDTEPGPSSGMINIDNNQAQNISDAGLRINPGVVNNLRVHGNLFNQLGDPGFYITGAGTNWSVTDNMIIKPLTEAILSSANVREYQIDRNTIRDVGQSDFGIIVSGTITNLSLRFNDIADDRTTPIMAYGMKFDGVTGNVVEEWNRVFGFTTARVFSNSTNSINADIVGNVGVGTSTPLAKLDVLGSVRGTNYTVVGTTNQIIFGATNTTPSSTVIPTKWISVQVQGESVVYRLPLYQ